MKKLIILTMVLLLPGLSDAQVGRLLRNVKSSIANEILNGGSNKDENQPAPEPSCASNDAEQVFDLGKYKIEYHETEVCILDDNSILLLDMKTNNYYISKDNVIKGPYKEWDREVVEFKKLCDENDNKDDDPLSLKNSKYISRSGEKFLISVGGKSFGPYAKIEQFIISKSGDKFVAVVVENIINTSDTFKKIQAEIQNAKTNEEMMQISMKYSAVLQEEIQSTGGGEGLYPVLVSNYPVLDINEFYIKGGQFTGKIKYDDILILSNDKIFDLQGHPVLMIKPGICNADNMFLSTDNTKYACYKYGTLTFSDDNILAELFNPHLLKNEGKVYLAYMYYSPGKNSIMLHKIPF
jgi:hypothetical protein